MEAIIARIRDGRVHLIGNRHVGSNWTEGSFQFCQTRIRAMVSSFRITPYILALHLAYFA